MGTLVILGHQADIFTVNIISFNLLPCFRFPLRLLQNNEQLFHASSINPGSAIYEVHRVSCLELCVWCCRCFYSGWKCSYANSLHYKQEAFEGTSQLLLDKLSSSWHFGWYVCHSHVCLPLDFSVVQRKHCLAATFIQDLQGGGRFRRLRINVHSNCYCFGKSLFGLLASCPPPH